MSEPCCMMNAGGHGCSCHAHRMLDEAREDAKRFGGGWLLMDPQGVLRRVSPPDVAAWVRRMESS